MTEVGIDDNCERNRRNDVNDNMMINEQANDDV